MIVQEIVETPIWQLFEKGRNFHRKRNVFSDTDRNYRFYNGNQWEGANLGGVEPVQNNFIKPIVKYKQAVIHDNLYAIVFSSMNFQSKEYQVEAERYCKMLNRYAARAWEADKMDKKGRSVTKDAAINDEGILYIDFDKEKMLPLNEVMDKGDVFYGNENDEDIQSQPYILIQKRMPQANALELAHALGMDESKDDYIIPDNDTFEQAGEDAKQEVDDMVTIVYKFYRKNGTVNFSVASRWATIVEDLDMGIKLYPIAHMTWEEKKGSARGEGEVRHLIPNQIEVNRIEMRRVIAVKQQAFPQKVADISKITNPEALDTVGATIKTQGQTVDDVRKVVGSIPPAQMSPDVAQLRYDLIQTSRDLAGAGDTATGQVDPESASGRAILAVQQASQAPMTEQKESFKAFIEDVAKIWLEYWMAHSEKGMDLEEEVTDENGQKAIVIVHLSQKMLTELQATVKIDVTPKSVYDRFAQEQTIENFLINGLFSPDRLNELEAYVDALDDDSVAPKQKLKEICESMRRKQMQIAMIETQTQLMQQRANQFLMEDPDGQASQIADAQLQLMEQGLAEEEAQMEGEA